MFAYKDEKKGTWYASFYYQNWKGVKEKKRKRGFPTKREALEWERVFLQKQSADMDMTFGACYLIQAHLNKPSMHPGQST